MKNAFIVYHAKPLVFLGSTFLMLLNVSCASSIKVIINIKITFAGRMAR